MKGSSRAHLVGVFKIFGEALIAKLHFANFGKHECRSITGRVARRKTLKYLQGVTIGVIGTLTFGSTIERFPADNPPIVDRYATGS